MCVGVGEYGQWTPCHGILMNNMPPKSNCPLKFGRLQGSPKGLVCDYECMCVWVNVCVSVSVCECLSVCVCECECVCE